MSTAEASGRDAGDLRAALRSARAQHRAGAGAVLDILLRGAADPDAVIARLPRQAGVEVLAEPTEAVPDFEGWSLERAREARCVVVRTLQGRRLLAAEDPWDEDMAQRVARHVPGTLSPAAARRVCIDAWLASPPAQSVPAVVASAPRPSEAARGAPAVADVDGGPIVAFVDQALEAAFRLGASDVHFECDRHGVRVQHRLDGVMVPFARMEGAQAAQEVVSRIKVLAQLDITERRLPQDGRFRFRFAAGDVDLRVSIMPSVHGEDAVLRLLDKSQLRDRDDRVTLDALGFSGASARWIRRLAGAPSGMLLITGPTGSGKTTTVYAALSEINTGLEKIITIEDPVEYELPGVLQIPVNERKGLTFATGLRSILRHDPDRILVGEIRDAETAEIAVQSALTGHLVFTTVHANSVADVVGRFRHFGIDMFGFMAALNGVVVQRLVRRLCPSCRTRRAATPEEADWLAAMRPGEAHGEVPAPVGCDDCRRTGYKGRFVIAEVHRIDDELRDHVAAGAPLSLLKTHAAKQGVVPLLEQAAAHVIEGDTTLDEVHRVIGGL
ncbi:MAG: GspE/PulE family protein [Burkholderiaceae bacterium]